jgi:hypothetical protein
MDPSGAPELLTAIGEARRALLAADSAGRTRAQLARDVEAFDDTTTEVCATGRDVGDTPDAALARLAEDCAANTSARAERSRLLEDASSSVEAATSHDDRVKQLDGQLQAAYQQVGATDAEAFAAAITTDAARKAAGGPGPRRPDSTPAPR